MRRDRWLPHAPAVAKMHRQRELHSEAVRSGAPHDSSVRAGHREAEATEDATRRLVHPRTPIPRSSRAADLCGDIVSAVATNPALTTELDPLQGDPRPLDEWLTTFPLALTVIDPFTHESSWILDSARRVMAEYQGSACRMAWLCCGTDDQAQQFLGPLGEETLTFTDPDRAMVKALGLETLPAFVLIRQDGSVAAAAEGWDPETWRDVAQALADLTQWSRPQIPAAGDPVAFPGTPALD